MADPHQPTPDPNSNHDSRSEASPSARGRAPLEFALPSTASQTIGLERYRGRTPVAVVFLGDHHSAAQIVESLDGALVEFGRRRTQLLVVATGSMAHALSLRPEEGTLPILADGDGAVTASLEAEGTDSTIHILYVGIDGSLIARTVVDRSDPVPAILAFVDVELRVPADTSAASE